MQPDTNLMKYLAVKTIADTGSFSEAAAKLGITQPSISRMVSDLERNFGFRIFDRDRSHSSLTSEGRMILPQINEICSGFGNLSAKLSEIRNLDSGHIVIGVFSSVATHWIPHIVTRFSFEYPQVTYEFLLGDYAELHRWVLEEKVDFAFSSLDCCGDLETLFLEDDELKAVVPKTDPCADAPFYPDSELERHPFFLLEKGGAAEISDYLASRGVRPQVKYRLWDDYAIMSMVENGMGISILHSLILRRIPYDVRILPLENPAYRRICLAWKPGKELSLPSRRFMEFVRYRNG